MDSSSDNSLALVAHDVNGYYERLVSLYWHELRAFVIGRVGHPQDAEDLVQDVFVRAYTAISRYSVQQRVTLKARSWLYKITWNVYFTHMSRSKAALLAPLDLSEESSMLEWEDEQGEPPDLACERVEQRQELEMWVAMLPQNYRMAVSLYYFNELDYQEIAEALNQPVGTVKSCVHRGIKLLRKAMTVHMSKVG